MSGQRALWLLLSWLWLSGQAWAAPAEQVAPRAARSLPRPCADELILALQAGPFWNADPGGTGGLAVLLRHGLLEVGAATGVALTRSDETRMWNEALRLGLGWQSRFGLRLDLLGAIGLDKYNSRPDWSVGDPGTYTFRGFGGVHAGASYLFAREGQGQFILGAFGFVEGDFDRSVKHYTYVAEDGSEVSAQYRFGATRFGVLLSFGISLDIDLHLPF